MPCLIVRNWQGALCGYAAVVREHPWHGKSYESFEARVDVHGGLTYSGACAGSICHVPAHGESDDVWWFGFDCAHFQDLVPRVAALEGEVPPFATYRDVAYVRGEVERLARQLRTTARSQERS